MRPVNRGNTNAEYQANVLARYDFTEINNLPRLAIQVNNYKYFIAKVKADVILPCPAQDEVKSVETKLKAVVIKYSKLVRENNLDDRTFVAYSKDVDKYKGKRRKYIHNEILKIVEKKLEKLEAIIAGVDKSISAVYPQSRKYLISQIGPYCSYCGMYVRANLAVEHMLPKSLFKSKSVDWDNFLLACTNCNSLKGSKPTNDSGKTPQEILNLYAWPDRDAMDYEYSVRNVTGLNYYQEKYTVIDEDTGKERSITTKIRDVSTAPPDASFTTDSIITTFENSDFIFVHHRGDIYVYTIKSRDSIKKIALSLSGTDRGALEKHNRTVDLCKLNKYVVDVDVTDRRVPCRTIVFLRVCSAMRDLNFLTNAPNNSDQLMNILVGQMKDTMLVTGYWSVWFWTLSTYFGASNKTAGLIAFLKDATAFPGTR